MTIAFNESPEGTLVPFIFAEIDPTLGSVGFNAMPYACLAIGQRQSTGTKAALGFDIITSAAQAREYYGAKSMLADMCAAWRANNPYGRLLAVALDDLVAGVAATASIQVTAAPSAAGTIYLYVNGERLTIGVTAAQTPTSVAAAIVAAITAETNLSVTAEVDGVDDTQANLTYVHKGVVGNDIDIRLNYYDDEDLPAGLALTITGFSGGTGNPDLADLVNVLPTEAWYNFVVHPYTDANNLTELEAELADRYGPDRQQDGVAITASRADHAGLITLGDSRNSKHTVLMMGYAEPEPPYRKAARTAAKVMHRGSIDESRQFKNVALEDQIPAKQADRLPPHPDRDLLLKAGISTTKVDDGGLVRLERVVTTYKRNAEGAEDATFRDLNSLLTYARFRWGFVNRLRLKYPDWKLADDGAIGDKIMTPKLGKAEAIAYAREREAAGQVENVGDFIEALVCVRHTTPTGDPDRLDWYLRPDIVNNFRIAGIQIAPMLQGGTA